MTDIAERLRDFSIASSGGLRIEAADEIERLRAENAPYTKCICGCFPNIGLGHAVNCPVSIRAATIEECSRVINRLLYLGLVNQIPDALRALAKEQGK